MINCIKDCPYASACKVHIEPNVDCSACRSQYVAGIDKACRYCGVMFPAKKACWFLPIKSRARKAPIHESREDLELGESVNGLTRSERLALATRICAEYRLGGTTQNRLADRYDTTQSIISKIVRGRMKYYSGSLKKVLILTTQ